MVYLRLFTVLTLLSFSDAFPFSLSWPSGHNIYGSLGRLITPDPANGHWVDTWTAMPQLTEFTNLPPAPFNQTDLAFDNATIRQTLKVTTPASQIRIRISNTFSPVELPITSMTIAYPVAEPGQNLTGSSAINETSAQTVMFSGNTSITIPPETLAVSDPLSFPVKTNQILSISMYLATGQASQLITSHPGSRTQIYISHGDYTRAKNMTDPSTQSTFHWYFLSAIEAWQSPTHSAFVILGDSLTDGRASFNNANKRWPDLLFYRLQSLPSPSVAKSLAISNQAAGGNRILADGNGPSLASRIERDVLAHPNVKYTMVFEGVNDIGTADATPYNQSLTGDRLIVAYQQIITKLHTAGLPVFGATITPFGCMNTTLQPYSDPLREGTRQRVNRWIRQTAGKRGGFDAVVDFDEVARDPRNETMLRPEFNSGDCLHLNGKGYEALAQAFPVDLLEKFDGGVEGFV